MGDLPYLIETVPTWAMQVAMMTLVEAGVAVRRKLGVYMIDKNLKPVRQRRLL